MKDRTGCIVDGQDRTGCIVDGHNCSSDYEEELMECGDFLGLMGITKELPVGSEVDIYIMAERIASLLGQCATTSDDDDLSSYDGDDDDDVLRHDVTADNSRVDWSNHLEHNLLLAGYSDCMDEAIRFLVEEEQYSVEHPIVQGLKQHLVSQQERVLGEAARGTTNNQTDANNRPAPAQRVDLCAIRPPSI